MPSEKYWVSGTPDEERVGTSRIERFNWTVRTGLRRFVRLSNGFSRAGEPRRDGNIAWTIPDLEMDRLRQVVKEGDNPHHSDSI
jgi:hypothetical protein